MLTPIIDALNDTLRVKFHSLARYALESQPYSVPDQAPLLESLRKIAAADETQAREAATRVEALQGIPVTGSPDPIVTEISYLDIRRLVEICLEKKRIEADDAAVRVEAVEKIGYPSPEVAEAQAFLEQVASSDRLQVEELERVLEATK